MEYSRIVAVTGMPGLFEIVTSKTDGAVVRSLEDGNTKFVSSRVHNLTHLESIEVYTTSDNVSLSDIFESMKNSSEALPDVKDNKALKDYFEKVFAELDFERVYASDMKKMVNWFKVLQQHNVDFSIKEEPEAEEEVTVEATTEEATEVAKPKKKKEKAVAEASTDDAPEAVKKTRKKKDS